MSESASEGRALASFVCQAPTSFTSAAFNLSCIFFAIAPRSVVNSPWLSFSFVNFPRNEFAPPAFCFETSPIWSTLSQLIPSSHGYQFCMSPCTITSVFSLNFLVCFTSASTPAAAYAWGLCAWFESNAIERAWKHNGN